MSIKFIAGLAIGAAIVHFLNTEEGQALIGRVKKDAAKVEDDLTTLTDGLLQKGRSLVGITDEPVVDTIVVLV
jgi:hypothetical protein